MVRPGAVFRVLRGIAVMLAMLAATAAPATAKGRATATPGAPAGFTFAVIGNVPERPEDVAPPARCSTPSTSSAPPSSSTSATSRAGTNPAPTACWKSATTCSTA